MSDAGEELPADLERTLEQLARAIGDLSPGNDVFEPMGLVRRWLAGLAPEGHGRFMLLLGSDERETALAAIARSVLSGAPAWPVLSPTESAAAVDDTAPPPVPLP